MRLRECLGLDITLEDVDTSSNDDEDVKHDKQGLRYVKV